MKAPTALLGFILVVATVACGKRHQTGDDRAKIGYCGQCQPCQWHPGERDDQGRLVAFEAGGLCKTLDGDYGLAFLNIGSNDAPVARYDLSSREDGYQPFSNLDDLTERIMRIPEPRIVDFYGTCGQPPFHGLPEKTIEGFHVSMNQAKVELRTERTDGGSNMICTCPCPKCK